MVLFILQQHCCQNCCFVSRGRWAFASRDLQQYTCSSFAASGTRGLFTHDAGCHFFGSRHGVVCQTCCNFGTNMLCASGVLRKSLAWLTRWFVNLGLPCSNGDIPLEKKGPAWSFFWLIHVRILACFSSAYLLEMLGRPVFGDQRFTAIVAFLGGYTSLVWPGRSDGLHSSAVCSVRNTLCVICLVLALAMPIVLVLT